MLASVGSSGFVATGRPVDFRVGAKADAVLFKENPIDNIAVLAHPSVIIREGRLL